MSRAAAAKPRYRMEAWSAEHHCTCPVETWTPARGHAPKCPFPTTTHRWEPMDDGPGGKTTWKPRATAEDAAAKAWAWTGRTGIPAMQVRDLETGEVVWRKIPDHPDAEDRGAGPDVLPRWWARVDAEVAASLRADLEHERAALRAHETPVEQPEPAEPAWAGVPASEQAALF